MSDCFFSDKEFYYGNISGDIYESKLKLVAGGQISGYRHRNEASWKTENGALLFLDKSGAVIRTFGEHRAGSKQHVLRGVNADGTMSELVLVRGEDVTPGRVVSELRTTLYSEFAPFNFVDEAHIDEGYPHTHISEDIVGAIASVVSPSFWLEVGSMLGGSAIKTANVLKRQNIDAGIVCVDPFCGDVNMWSWERGKKLQGEWQFLKLERGRPTIYDRFLANVTAAGHADIILPITTTSIVGFKLLRRLFLEGRLSALPDVIYLDSAHEPEETLLELKSAWQTLRDGGVLFGDDWTWPAVRNDVTKFAKKLPQNQARIKQLQERHPDFEMAGDVLLDKKREQWVLVK